MNGIDERTVIHCKDKTEAEQVLRIFILHNLKWNTGVSYKEEHNYHFHKGETCYHPAAGLFSSRSYYEREGYKIISTQEFLDANKT